jgi:hypothetical protein
MVRKTTDKLIEVIVNGTYADVENIIKTYRVKVEMPDCLDEWLMTNIKNKYILQTIKRGKEYQNKKEIENADYLKASTVKSLNIEEIDENGNSLLKVTDKLPSFYGKSLFNFSYSELQDFSVAFGLHTIRNYGSIETMRMDAFLEYLQKIKGIDENKIKQFSFYKYDKVRRKYSLELSEEERNGFIIDRRECYDLKEFHNQDTRISEGNRSVLDLVKLRVESEELRVKQSLIFLKDCLKLARVIKHSLVLFLFSFFKYAREIRALTNALRAIENSKLKIENYKITFNFRPFAFNFQLLTGGLI